MKTLTFPRQFFSAAALAAFTFFAPAALAQNKAAAPEAQATLTFPISPAQMNTLEDVASSMADGTTTGPLGSISGDDSICTLSDTVTYTLNIAAPNGSSLTYYWFTPAGWRILSGQSTPSITVVADSATDGFISVFAVGYCICNYSCIPVNSSDCGTIDPLPVQLTAFSAKRSERSVQLNWSTASEINNREFVVERSFNGKSFNAIGAVSGNGTSTRANTYAYTDAQALAGVSYYRLKQVDIDGKFEYSPVRVVAASSDVRPELSAYPNPAVSSVQLNLPVEATGVVRVLSLTGQVVFEGSAAQLAAQNNQLDVSQLPAGSYLVSLSNGSTQSTVRINKL